MIIMCLTGTSCAGECQLQCAEIILQQPDVSGAAPRAVPRVLEIFALKVKSYIKRNARRVHEPDTRTISRIATA
jgi:hypothetical protein